MLENMIGTGESTGIYIHVCLLKNNMHNLFSLYMLECRGVVSCLSLAFFSPLFCVVFSRSSIEEQQRKFALSLSFHVREGLHKRQVSGTR